MKLRDETFVSYRRKVFASFVFFAIVILIIYGNTFDCSWHFDDIPNITDNPNLHFNTFSWGNLKKALYSDMRGPDALYRPVSCLSFALNYYLGGLNVFGYHIVNIIIHIFSSFFVFLFIYHTLHLPSLHGKYVSRSYSIALLATILWAANPIQTQSITYIVQRMTSLAGLFYISSLYCYLRARTALVGNDRWLFYLACVVSGILAFGSKENAFMLPFSILLYEILLIREDDGGSSVGKTKWVPISIGLGFFILLGIIYLNSRGGGLLSFMNGYGIRPFTATQRVLTEARIILFYVSLLIYPMPQRLSIAHSFPISNSIIDPIGTLVSVLVIAAALIFLFFNSRRYPLVVFSYLFFFLNHLIESTILPLELVFEHRNYVPSILFFLPISIGIIWIFDKYSMKGLVRYALSVSVVFLIISIGHSTYMRNFAWKTPGTLWLDAAEKAPDQFRVHHSLATHYQDIGHIKEALSEYMKALDSPVRYRRDEVIKSYYNLGNLYRELKDDEKAESFYQKALQVKPDFARALGSLASIYDQRGNRKKADEYLMKAYQADPGDPNINLNMAIYHLDAGRAAKAVRHLTLSERSERTKKKALLPLGIAYKQQGLFGKAVHYLNRAVEADRHNLTPHLYLAEIYAITGHRDRGLEEVSLVVDVMIKDNRIFDKTMDYLTEKGPAGHSRPSPHVIIPLIREVCENRTSKLNGALKRLNDLMQRDLGSSG